MSTFEELDRLSSEELHDRAIHRATRHLDIKFLWKLMGALPAAEAAAGRIGEADADVQHASAVVADAFREGTPEVQDALRPIFIEYLLEHDDA
jgi:hypothetical protein